MCGKRLVVTVAHRVGVAAESPDEVDGGPGWSAVLAQSLGGCGSYRFAHHDDLPEAHGWPDGAQWRKCW